MTPRKRDPLARPPARPAPPAGAGDPRWLLPLRFLSRAQADQEGAPPEPAAGPPPGLHVVRLDGARLPDAQALFAALAQALRFPDYFGHGWDALLDMLRDLSWLEAPQGAAGAAPGVVLIIDRAARLWGRAYPVAAQLTEVWLQAAAERGQGDAPFQLQFVDG